MSGPVVLVFRILLALALYAFLGWALWTIWQDLKHTGSQAATQKVRVIRLGVRLKNRSVVYRSFSQPEVILGRDPVCDVPIDDEAASARHAKLSFHHGQWWIEDLVSTNGTSLNHEKLTTATVLTSGDEIKCGKARLTVYLSGEPLIPQILQSEEGHDRDY
jgi:pSer/pThr/pTyr-binding forkhead associated (FHA) protein